MAALYVPTTTARISAQPDWSQISNAVSGHIGGQSGLAGRRCPWTMEKRLPPGSLPGR